MIRRGAVLAVAIVAAFVAAVLAWAAWRSRDASRAPEPVSADSTSVGIRAVRLYFARGDGSGLVPESRERIEPSGLHDRVADLVAELARGPEGRGARVLPAGTTLRHVYLDDDGTLTVDLSAAFLQGFRGGTSAEELAIGSLVRTLAANLPETKRVLLTCGGSPIVSLGGHLPLDRPLDVSDWL